MLQRAALDLILVELPHSVERALRLAESGLFDDVPKPLRRSTIARTLRALNPYLEDCEEGEYPLTEDGIELLTREEQEAKEGSPPMCECPVLTDDLTFELPDTPW